MKKIVYCGQFMDLSGYGIAARKYLKILDPVVQKNNINFKIYSTLGAVLDMSALSAEERELINKYSFDSNEEINDFIKSPSGSLGNNRY
mgnify:CR=1 FL=1